MQTSVISNRTGPLTDYPGMTWRGRGQLEKEGKMATLKAPTQTGWLKTNQESKNFQNWGFEKGRAQVWEGRKNPSSRWTSFYLTAFLLPNGKSLKSDFTGAKRRKVGKEQSREGTRYLPTLKAEWHHLREAERLILKPWRILSNSHFLCRFSSYNIKMTPADDIQQ